jgi:proline iminopeptidase
VESVIADDGVALWALASGGGIPMVCCHGGPGHWDSFDGLAELLRDVAAVHRWDQRGCGRSQRAGPYTIERSVQDLECLRAAAGVERWVVLGHSWGATLALHYAVAHSERTLGVVYLSGMGLVDDWDAGNRAEANAEADRRLSQSDRECLLRLASLAVRTAEEEYEFRLRSWGPDVRPGLPAEEILAPDLHAPWTINFEANRALMADTRAEVLTFRSALPSLDVPVLVLHGRYDPRPHRGASEVAALLPRSHLQLLDTGHSPWLEDPAGTSAVLRAWLAEIPQ